MLGKPLGLCSGVVVYEDTPESLYELIFMVHRDRTEYFTLEVNHVIENALLNVNGIGSAIIRAYNRFTWRSRHIQITNS